MSYLVQLLLPLYANDGERLAGNLFEEVRNELVSRFGGLTAYTRTPVDGLWTEAQRKTVHDELVIYEVMTEHLDPSWWSGYRAGLETRFRQKELVVRAIELRLL